MASPSPSPPPSPSTSSESDNDVQVSIRLSREAHRRNVNKWYMVLGFVLIVVLAVAFGVHRPEDTYDEGRKQVVEGHKQMIEGRNRQNPTAETKHLLEALEEMNNWHEDWNNRIKDVAKAATDNALLSDVQMDIGDALSYVIIAIMTGETACGHVSAIYSELELAAALLPLDAHQAVRALAHVLGVMRSKLQESIMPKINKVAANPRYQALYGIIQAKLSALDQYTAELQAECDAITTSRVWWVFALIHPLGGGMFARLERAVKELQQALALKAELEKLAPIVDGGKTLKDYGDILNTHLLPDVLYQDFLDNDWVDVATLEAWASEPHRVPHGGRVYDHVVADLMILLGQMDRYNISGFC